MHKMRSIATDDACSVVCVICALVSRMYFAKTAEPIALPFVRLTHVDPKNHILNGVKIGRIHSQPTTETSTTSRRCGLLPNYFEH